MQRWMIRCRFCLNLWVPHTNILHICSKVNARLASQYRNINWGETLTAWLSSIEFFQFSLEATHYLSHVQRIICRLWDNLPPSLSRICSLESVAARKSARSPFNIAGQHKSLSRMAYYYGTMELSWSIAPDIPSPLGACRPSGNLIDDGTSSERPRSSGVKQVTAALDHAWPRAVTKIYIRHHVRGVWAICIIYSIKNRSMVVRSSNRDGSFELGDFPRFHSLSHHAERKDRSILAVKFAPFSSVTFSPRPAVNLNLLSFHAGNVDVITPTHNFSLTGIM